MLIPVGLPKNLLQRIFWQADSFIIYVTNYIGYIIWLVIVHKKVLVGLSFQTN